MQLEFDLVWEPKVVEFGPVAVLCDTTIYGVPIIPMDNENLEDWLYD